jgi:hypothetical protein
MFYMRIRVDEKLDGSSLLDQGRCFRQLDEEKQ